MVVTPLSPNILPQPTTIEIFASTATVKPKGKNPAIAPTSANTNFIATETLGRPTDTSITVNVVPAVAMEISYEYGTQPGDYTAQTATQTAAAGEPIEALIEGVYGVYGRK